MSHGNSPTPDRTNSLSSPLSMELVNFLKESMGSINTDPHVFVVFGASVSWLCLNCYYGVETLTLWKACCHFIYCLRCRVSLLTL